MWSSATHFSILLGLAASLAVAASEPVPAPAPVTKLPTDTILVKGAWSSASDSTTPLPEAGTVSPGSYDNRYFGLTLPLPNGWIQKYAGPPPSDSGYYVLAQLVANDNAPQTGRGTALITAQDLFFSSTRANSPLELINYTRDHLQAAYQIERTPVAVTIAGRNFVRFGYRAPAAGLHWSILATQMRCHVVEFVFTSANTQLLEMLERDLSSMKLSQSDDAAPVCIKDYANATNIIERVEPLFGEPKFNAVPVRIVIDREGKVKHIHFLSAFPAQAQAITAAVSQWRFKPYKRDGQALEVETGILFGRGPRAAL